MNNVTSPTGPSREHAVQQRASAALPVEYGHSQTLAASWQRSAQHGLRRSDRALFNTSISHAISKRVNDESRELVDQARPEMVRLYEGLGCARWVALCINPMGQIVGFTGDRSSAPPEIRVLMVPGRSLVEAELGTNAPGCAIEERRFVIVEREEHFLAELGHFFCACAPILAPDGRLAGALDITGVDVRTLELASDMVGLAVRRIENGFLAAMKDCHLLRFHADERLLGTPFEATLAVDESGAIRGVNRGARQLLGLGADCGIGATLDTVFEHGLQGVVRRVTGGSDPIVRVHSERGAFAFRSIEPPRSAAPCSNGRPAGESRRRAAFVKENPALKSDFEKAVRIISSGLPIILEGETGTGKEVFADVLHRAIHPDGPFVAINCAAIPEGLIEAELFGYAEGAFTGGRKGGAIGKIEQADKGTLLLDEIGDMSMELQSRLLRVLQERTVTRIGDSRQIPVNITVICATHRDLKALIASGQFRQDLYYRLSGYVVRVPPLRERDDRSVVIQTLLRRWGDAHTHLDELMTAGAREQLMNFPWPGNIRQLEQTIRTMLALRTEGEPADLDDLPPEIREQYGSDEIAADSPALTLESAEKGVICSALQAHEGNLSATARALKISRGTLYGKLKRLGLRS